MIVGAVARCASETPASLRVRPHCVLSGCAQGTKPRAESQPTRRSTSEPTKTPSAGKDAQTGVRRQQRHGAGGQGGRGDESRGQKQCSKGGYGSCRVRGLPRPVCQRCLVFPASSLPVSSLPSPLYCPPFGLSRVHCLTFWLLLAPLRPWRRLGREVQRTGGRTATERNH